MLAAWSCSITFVTTRVINPSCRLPETRTWGVALLTFNAPLAQHFRNWYGMEGLLAQLPVREDNHLGRMVMSRGLAVQ